MEDENSEATVSICHFIRVDDTKLKVSNGHQEHLLRRCMLFVMFIDCPKGAHAGCAIVPDTKTRPAP